VLHALAHPASLLVLLASFVVGITLHGWVQTVVACRLGDTRLRHEGRLRPYPRRHLEAFGVLAAGLSGLGWARPVTLPARRRRVAAVAVAVAGPLANLVLGLAVLLVLRLTYGPVSGLSGGLALELQRGLPLGGSVGALSLLLVGASQLYLGALSLIPIPPLDGGRLLFAFSPRSSGWQRAEYWLVDQNAGVAVVLALLVIPLGSGGLPLLLELLDTLLGPVLNALLGG
jgi:Zn-dependent protease